MKAIPLNHGLFATVDDDDFESLNRLHWYAVQSDRMTYAVHAKWMDGRPRFTFMHRLLLSCPDGLFVDHKDGDGLNNQRENIRVCTTAQNAANMRKTTKPTSSRFKGVWYCKARKKFKADITVNQKKISLGYHEIESNAALAYNAGAIKYFGEFARLNEIESVAR